MEPHPLEVEAQGWTLSELIHFLVICVSELARRLRLGDISSREPERETSHRGRSRSPWHSREAWEMLAPWTELDQYTTTTEVLAHFAVADPVWQAINFHTGQLGEDLRLLAALPKAALTQACLNAVLMDGSPLTPAQATQAGLVWRMARKIMAYQAGMQEAEFQDIDPWAEPPTREERTKQVNNNGVKEKVLKMASLVDQNDESELLPPDLGQVDQWTQNYVLAMGSHPDEAEEPTAAQLAALAKKVDGGLAPYTDFAIWVPFERRMSRLQKCRIFAPLGNGQYLQRDLPGPPNYMAWRASWNVYRTACLMLGTVSLSALEAYARHVERLTVQWPNCWGLIYQADDCARSEKLDRIKRQIMIESGRGRQVPLDWNPNKPWSCVYNVLVKDVTYWSEKVHVPAAAWTAAGSRGLPVVATEAAVLRAIPGGEDALGGKVARHDEPKVGTSKRERREAKKRKIAADREELAAFRKSSGGSSSGHGKGKAKGKGKTKDQAGSQICFAWASNTGSCAGLGPGAECKGAIKRVHKCRICLSPSHRDDQCPQSSNA